jgi:hypothetical protein
MGVPLESSPESTLAVVLGASEFPNLGIRSDSGFLAAAEGFTAYLRDSIGYGLPEENLHFCFNFHRGTDALYQGIGDFAKTRIEDVRSRGHHVADVLVYYVGHGYVDNQQHYHLALRSTRQINYEYTSLTIEAVFREFTGVSNQVRLFLILDACFAGEVLKQFQAVSVIDPLAQQLREEPSRGSAVLCSSPPDLASLVLPDHSNTAFTSALTEVLRHGSSKHGRRLNLNEVRDLVHAQLMAKYQTKAVRPEVRPIKQQEGDISKRVGLFPNPAFKPILPQLSSRHHLGEDEAYAVILLNGANTPPGVYEDAMKIYRESFGMDQLTDAQEIAYWRFEYNSRYASTDDKFYLYALSDKGITCGFAMIAFMSEMNVAIVDYLVIAEAHRDGLIAFTEFYKGIKRHLESSNCEVAYAVAEIDVDHDSYESSKAVWEIFKWVNFSVVDLDYRGAPMTDKPLEPTKLALWSASGVLSLSPDNIRRIIYCIFDWNRRWCEQVMSTEELSVYLDTFKARLAHNESRLKGAQRVQLLEELPPRESNVDLSEYPSCFISYCNEDEDFAFKLAADLRNSSVECSFARHDRPIGANVWDGILNEIGKRDKILVILSAHSLPSCSIVSRPAVKPYSTVQQ